MLGYGFPYTPPPHVCPPAAKRQLLRIQIGKAIYKFYLEPDGLIHPVDMPHLQAKEAIYVRPYQAEAVKQNVDESLAHVSVEEAR